MKAQRHSSVSVTETSRSFRQISTRRLLLAFAFTGCVAVCGCHTPPKDENGNCPSHVVREFIELVQAEDYKAARDLWYGPSKRITGPMRFEKFCARYKNIDLSNCTISEARRGKAGFWMVDVDWRESGQNKHDHFGLKIVHG